MDVANYLLNQKRKEITHLEDEYNITVHLGGNSAARQMNTKSSLSGVNSLSSLLLWSKTPASREPRRPKCAGSQS